MKSLRIIGTRGVPAAHGGFETFAERLALYLVARGWNVTVYCQHTGRNPTWEDSWQGIRRVNICAGEDTPAATIAFDWKAIAHAARAGEPCLTLGYNTAVFCARLRMAGVRNAINMDGIEWRRAKWGAAAKAWFWMNELAGSWLGDMLVADHPDIKRHLARHVSPDKIQMIPYGADKIVDADATPLRVLELQPGTFMTLIARPEPENSVLEVVRQFSAQTRHHTLAVLGKYSRDNEYHRKVLDAAGPEVRFLGAIYDKHILHALRSHCTAYIHGHQVGGTNPSLVEALGAGNAVIAHDNAFNRWVAQDAALYFDDAASLESALAQLLADPGRVRQMRSAALGRHQAEFTWDSVLQQYEAQLLRLAAASAPRTPQ